MSGFVEDEGSIYLAPLQDNLQDIEDVWDILGPSYLLQVSPGLPFIGFLLGRHRIHL